jgi:ABC-type branched-subunit amino acid transport system substrate-binding protein
VSATNAYAYFSADMFIEAIKNVEGDITPESVQQALANQTWEIEGFVGPVEYLLQASDQSLNQLGQFHQLRRPLASVA